MKLCLIDPPSSAYDDGRFFDLNNAVLNRDDSLLPFYQLKSDLTSIGYTVDTFDRYVLFNTTDLKNALYISFSRKRDLKELKSLGVNLFAYYLLEPPLVDPKMYESLPELTANFSHVFIHNLEGDCYSLKNVDQSKLRKIYWPQPHNTVSLPVWNKTNRMTKVVLINGHHKPHGFKNRELYSERIIWAKKLSPYIEVDLFGRGWLKKITRSNLWMVYLKNYFFLKSIFKGSCSSKKDTMSDYKFALCFENLQMKGYITEKIFDCFYSGTIPIYWGGSDIEKWIPGNTYIQLKNFETPESLGKFLKNLPENEIENYKKSAKDFLSSPEAQGYFSLFSNLKNHLEKV